MGSELSIDDLSSVASTSLPDAARLRDGFLPALSRLTFGLIRWRRWALHLGPVELLHWGEPEAAGSAWVWPIQGGLLTGRPGGLTAVAAEPGRLLAWIEGYRPSLPAPLYRLAQLPVHRLFLRLFLLQQRGRVPPPGVPAAPALRLAAAALDLGACALLASAVRRRRRLSAWLVLSGLYQLAFWSLDGRTPAARLLGLRLVSVDGGRVTPGQALIRLLAVPRAILDLRATHDELAATDVIESPGGS